MTAEDDDLPFVQFGRADDDRPQRPVRTWWFVVAAALIVVVGLVVGIIVFNASAPDAPRGGRTADGAARQWLAAVNAGDRHAAAAISCDTFADEAQSDASTAKDPDIAYTLDSVQRIDKTSAAAMVTEHLKFSGTTTQTVPSTISVLRSNGRWLMCGPLS